MSVDALDAAGPSLIPPSGSDAGSNSSGPASAWKTGEPSGAWLGTGVGVDSVVSVDILDA